MKLMILVCLLLHLFFCSCFLIVRIWIASLDVLDLIVSSRCELFLELICGLCMRRCGRRSCLMDLRHLALFLFWLSKERRQGYCERLHAWEVFFSYLWGECDRDWPWRAAAKLDLHSLKVTIFDGKDALFDLRVIGVIVEELWGEGAIGKLANRAFVHNKKILKMIWCDNNVIW